MKQKHSFSSYILDPIPKELWRQAKPIDDMKLGFCDICGFVHTDPYPPFEYLSEFYTNYEMPTPQENLSETARLLGSHLEKDAVVIDMGCGDGSFLKEMHQLGFNNLIGFDQSPGLERAKNLEFGDFYQSNVWDFLSEVESSNVDHVDADALVMVNVLEHVVEPIELLSRVYDVLPENGLLCITVPNDFSPLQQAFLKAKGHQPWFVYLPDHVNYFDFSTLKSTLNRVGFEMVDQTALYPLEMFLLQDLDYVENPSLGPVAHERRVMFEQNIKDAGMTDTLDHFYKTLAAGGYGRDVMVVCRKTSN
jgi:SAM-dependent methyltransferase